MNRRERTAGKGTENPEFDRYLRSSKTAHNGLVGGLRANQEVRQICAIPLMLRAGLDTFLFGKPLF